MQTKTEILIEAARQLARSIDSIDGVANAVIFETAQRLDELQTALQSAQESLVLARNERDKARAEIDAICKAQQPDRVKIAAIILAGSYSNCASYDEIAKIGLKQADALIAAATEAQ